MTYDLIVIGSGPAGQKAALGAAKSGKKVAIVEIYPALGGNCTHFGTLPSKSIRESVYRFSLGSQGILGQETTRKQSVKRVSPDMRRLMQRKDRVVQDEAQVVFDQLKRNHVTVIYGKARFLDAHTLEIVGGKKGVLKITGKFIFIATGSSPVTPAHLPIDSKRIHDSNTILKLTKTPRSVIVLGAGIIGCEYASMLSMAGAKVYFVDKRESILASVDREIVKCLVDRFIHEGMELVLGTEALRVVPTRVKDSVTLQLGNGRKLKADVVLVAQGRLGNTDELRCDLAGIKLGERGLIPVDGYFRTSMPHIYAIGDVIGAPALASTSMEQGRIAACHAFGILETKECAMPGVFPYGIYTIPEISMIGLTEAEAKSKKLDFVVGRSHYRELARGQIVGDRWGLLKLLVDRKTHKLLGVHIIGDNAADLIHIGQAVMDLGGDVHYLVRAVFNYPTLAEGYKIAALHVFNQLDRKKK